jgi:hypothetical protein
MSWLYSRALVAAFSEERCSGGELSAQLSGESTPLAFCALDRMTVFSRLSRFGVTFKPLTEPLGADVLTWFLAGFPAKTSALQAKAQELTAPAAECGHTWRASLAKYDPASSSWRTAQPSLLEDSEECSVTWPRSGMTAAGQCWELPTLERPTGVTGSGLSLPTPSASHCETRPAKTWNPKSQSGRSLGCMAATGMWPTPVASDTSSRKKPYAQGGTPLSLAVIWPTPTVCGNYNRKGASATSGDGLATAVRMWPTPTASNGLDGGSNSREACKKAGLAVPTAGALNPTWVEWLMGWPLGWTDLRRLEMDKSPNVPQPHGGF